MYLLYPTSCTPPRFKSKMRHVRLSVEPRSLAACTTSCAASCSTPATPRRGSCHMHPAVCSRQWRSRSTLENGNICPHVQSVLSQLVRLLQCSKNTLYSAVLCANLSVNHGPGRSLRDPTQDPRRFGHQARPILHPYSEMSLFSTGSCRKPWKLALAKTTKAGLSHAAIDWYRNGISSKNEP